MKMRVLVLASTLAALATLTSAATPTPTPSTAQLSTFGDSTTGPIGVLTTSSGCPIQFRDTSTLNNDLISNEYFVDALDHFISERIPERVAHAKGAGAFGYFQVTHDVTDLTKAKFLSQIGKKTRVVTRFSPTIPERGGSDIAGATRGFAVKFYTEEGNWDMTGFNTPVFPIRDPLKFPALIHAIKRNPVTDLADLGMTWDFLTLNPEAFHAFLLSISPYGTPDGNKHMRGHSIHTMQFANSKNETNFARFYFEPDLGVKNLTIGSTNDTDYFGRDLFDSIGAGSFPSWTVYVQPLSLQDVLDAKAKKIDVFDVSRELDRDLYPLRQVGKLVLNENPKNYYADVELLAFCPGNVVPGIVGAPDTMFAARSLTYRLAAVHRLGINFNKIPVNRPLSPVFTYNRDGSAPNLDNEGGAPNYFPNSFNGPQPEPDHQPKIIEWQDFGSYNPDQTTRFVLSLNEADYQALVNALVQTLAFVTGEKLDNAYNLLKSIDQKLLDSVTDGISKSS